MSTHMQVRKILDCDNKIIESNNQDVNRKSNILTFRVEEIS